MTPESPRIGHDPRRNASPVRGTAHDVRLTASPPRRGAYRARAAACRSNVPGHLAQGIANEVREMARATRGTAGYTRVTSGYEHETDRYTRVPTGYSRIRAGYAREAAGYARVKGSELQRNAGYARNITKLSRLPLGACRRRPDARVTWCAPGLATTRRSRLGLRNAQLKNMCSSPGVDTATLEVSFHHLTPRLRLVRTCIGTPGHNYRQGPGIQGNFLTCMG